MHRTISVVGNRGLLRFQQQYLLLAAFQFDGDRLSLLPRIARIWSALEYVPPGWDLLKLNLVSVIDAAAPSPGTDNTPPLWLDLDNVTRWAFLTVKFHNHQQ